MANIEVYREYVQAILKKYESYQSENDPIASQIIFDTERDHYQLVHVGWRDWRRYYGCVVHIDIQDGKIWIQHDGRRSALLMSWSIWVCRSRILFWRFKRLINESIPILRSVKIQERSPIN